MSQPLCPDCLSPTAATDRFCSVCGAVVHVFAELDPMNILRAEGEMFRRGMQRPKPVVLIGIWLLLLPVFLILIVPFLSYGRIVYQIPGLILTAIYGAILYRVTASFLRMRAEKARSVNSSLLPKNENE